jgi:DNA-binding NtrC family response regulator
MAERSRDSSATPRILIVDDERAIRDLLEAMLRRRKYDVVGALAPAAALPWISDQAHAIDLLITDVSMPGINGAELAAQLREYQPELPVIFMSGYANIQGARSATAGDRERFLAKPFKFNDLFAAIESLIGAE